MPVGDIRDAIAPFRTERITTDQLNAALYRLPAQGELIPDAQEVAKLARLDALFASCSRIADVVTKVVDLPRARIGLYARSILLVSRPALNLLTAVELQAVAAHELGRATSGMITTMRAHSATRVPSRRSSSNAMVSRRWRSWRLA